MKNNSNKVLLSLGSNFNKECNIAFARKCLSEFFTALIFSADELTRPVDWITNDKFLNCVAVGFTDADKEGVLIFLKKLEKECGRTEELKEKGIVPLDIDLLKWNDEILKAGDLDREYVITALASLGE